MIEIEQFINAVNTVHRDRGTGRLRISSRVDDKLVFATLFFAEGELRDCEFRDLTGKPAINDLLGHAIVSSVFIRGEVPTGGGNSNIPDVDTLISLAQERQVELVKPTLDPREITSIVTNILEESIGKRAAALVAEIAQRNPPDTAAKVFLQECEQLAAEIIGARKARDSFQSLHALIE